MTFFAEKFGKRTVMLIGIIGILTCLICETALQTQFLGTTNRAGQDAAVFFIFLFITPFWSGFYGRVAEIFPTHIRRLGTAVSMHDLYLAEIILLVAGPIALNNITRKFFIVLVVPTFLDIIFVYFVCPETTKGRLLEDINAQFGEQVAIHEYGATEAEKTEPERAAQKDEEMERHGQIVSLDEKDGIAQEIEVSPSRV